MRGKVRNKEIRVAMALADIKQWELAEAIGVSEVTICRWLRVELDEDKKEAILDVIKRMVAESEA